MRSEFWAYPQTDFCADLHEYTAALLAAPAPPLVNSVSYGYQGNLSALGCTGTAPPPTHPTTRPHPATGLHRLALALRPSSPPLGGV